MEHALNENDRARLYFLQEQMKDRINVENSSEDLSPGCSYSHGNMPDTV